MSDRCFRHWMFYRLSQRGLTKGTLNQTNKNLREKLVGFLSGRFHAVRRGAQPWTYGEAYRAAVKCRIRLNLTWGGQRGGEKIAELIQQVDRKAIQCRKKSSTTSTTP